MTIEEYKKISSMLSEFEKELLATIEFRTKEMKDIFENYLSKIDKESETEQTQVEQLEGQETTASKIQAEELLNEPQ